MIQVDLRNGLPGCLFTKKNIQMTKCFLIFALALACSLPCHWDDDGTLALPGINFWPMTESEESDKAESQISSCEWLNVKQAAAAWHSTSIRSFFPWSWIPLRLNEVQRAPPYSPRIPETELPATLKERWKSQNTINHASENTGLGEDIIEGPQVPFILRSCG